MPTLDIVGLCGSLRAGSLNRMALNLAAEVMPPAMRLEIAEFRDIPLYDADLQAQGMPPALTALAERLRRANGIVIATPEYNYSIPGVLKNAIDWLSRLDAQPFARKPVALLSASPGALGGARVQYDLRKVLLFVDAAVLIKPEIFISAAPSKFDADGRCTDEPTRRVVGKQMAAFEQWIAGVSRMNTPG